jgi:uncharacterized GH25 family protein
MTTLFCHTDTIGSQSKDAVMRYLLFLLLFLSGFTEGPFNSTWGGEIQGQVLRVISDKNVVPVANLEVNIVEEVGGIRACKITPETKPKDVTTDENGIFSIGALKAGWYYICAEFDYEADPDSGRRHEVSIATHVYVSKKGVTKVTVKKSF